MFLCLISLCHDQYFKPALGLRLRLKQNITSKIDANTSGIIVLYSLLTLIYTNSFQFTYAGFSIRPEMKKMRFNILLLFNTFFGVAV